MILQRKPYNEPYVPTRETIEFFVWFNTYFTESNKSAAAHFQMVDHINHKGKFKVVECFRGMGKSSVIGIYYLIYIMFTGKKFNLGKVDYILYVMDTVSQVASNFEQIIMMIDDNPALKEVLHIEKSRLGDDPTIYFYNKQLNRKMYLKGRGSGQKLRGLRMGGHRPQLIIGDDLENDENVENRQSRDKLKAWFFNALIPSIDPSKSEVILIGTPLHMDSLLVNLVESEQWKAIQLPVAEKYPVTVGEPVVSAWDDRFTHEYIDELYKMYEDQGKRNSFYQEMMLIVVPAENRLYDMGNIKRFKKETMQNMIGSLTYYMSVDLAVSEKDYADYTAIVVIGIDDNNNWFLVDGFFGRIKPDITIDKIFYYERKWKPYSVVLEKVAFQLSMKTFIQNEMLKRGRVFNLEMVSRTKSKLSVIKAFQPVIELGRFWIPDDYLQEFTGELTYEMEMITNEKILCKHDDLIDAVSQLTLIDMLSIAPSYDAGSIQYMPSYKNSYVF